MNSVQRAQDIAYRLAKLANSGPIPCSEGYGPVWELYRQLQAAIWKLETPMDQRPADLRELLREARGLRSPPRKAERRRINRMEMRDDR